MLSQNQDLLRFIDYFFLVFHSGLILFNLFGWLWKPLRKWHLAVISLTFASWGILGIWYGWGYCPLTDWHWDVLYLLGETDLPYSYISYLLRRLLSVELPDSWVDMMTLMLALLALTASLKVNFFTKPPES